MTRLMAADRSSSFALTISAIRQAPQNVRLLRSPSWAKAMVLMIPSSLFFAWPAEMWICC